MEVHAHVPKIGAAQAHWLLEGLFIVLSVGLAFGLAELGDSRANHELAARVLKSVRTEIEHNLTILEPMVPVHRKWMKALESADTSNVTQSGLDVWFATRPTLPEGATSFPLLRRSAWDAAVSGGALRLIDYDVAASLADVYRAQEIATQNVDRLANGALSTTATFDPASRAASVRLLWLTLADIESAESTLLGLYRKHLPVIRAAEP